MCSINKQVINKTTIFTGIGCIQECNSYLATLKNDSKNKVVLFTSKGQIERGLPFNSLSFDKIVFCQPNPDLDDLDNVIADLKNINPSLIIAFGGGSVLDSAKVVSTFLHSDISLNEYFRESSFKDYKFTSRVKLICIPTTSGTGAEITPFATVWDTKEQLKRSFSSELLEPDFIYLDASVTISAPKELTVFCALDAISHALESLWNKNITQESMKYAKKSLELISDYLLPLLSDLKNSNYREKIQLASFYSGCAIRITRTAIAHSISYPLTLKYDVPHGLACGFTLVKIIDLVLKNNGFIEEISKELILRVSSILKELNTDMYIQRYCTFEQIQSLSREMYAPGRADNFIVKDFELLDILPS